jgi:hypothetical protein
MDRARFDAIAKLLATTGSRRAALGALIGVGLLGQGPDDIEAKRKGKGRSGDNDRNKNKGRGKGKGKAKDKKNPRVSGEAKKNKKKSTQPQPTANPGSCCGNKSCSPPTAASDRGHCNFAGANFAGVNAAGSNIWYSNGTGTTYSTDARPSNLSRVNFKYACLGGAIFRKADLRSSDLQGTCLVDADLTGAQTNSGTNFWNAIFCRTKMPDGSINNSGCGGGTSCCPTCDERRPCPDGQKCCNGKCVTCPAATDCKDQVCDGGRCVLANKQNGVGCPGGVCCGGTCQAGKTCCDSAQCNGQVCCNGTCCTGGAQCVGGQCQTCNSTTCPRGCCNAQGQCVSPPTNQACGIKGVACQPCPDGKTCDDTTGTCVCKPNCKDKVCGSDGCGKTCGTCPAGTECNGSGTACVCTAQSCPPDPALVCKERKCVGAECKTVNTTNGEPGPNCRGSQEVCQNGECICKPNCAGKVCGPDGCGKTCGTCPQGTECNQNGTACVCTAQSCPKGCCNAKGECVNPPTDQACGIGGVACKACPNGKTCNPTTGQCDCVPNCKDKVCGSDGCDGQCPPGCDTNNCFSCDADKGICEFECGCGATCDGKGKCTCPPTPKPNDDLGDNPTCADLGEANGFRVDPPESGCRDYAINGCTCRVCFTLSGDEITLDEFNSTCLIDKIIVKGGPAANVYDYEIAGTTCGGGLVSPPLDDEGKLPEISHFDFCGLRCCPRPV